MSLYGINPSGSNPSGSNPLRNTTGTPVRPDPRSRPAAPAVIAPQQPLKSQAPIAAATPAVPAEAPNGTDPELWSVLTTEERTFFAKTASMGPLTYGRIKAVMSNAAPPAARGVRLDVRA